MGVKGPQSRPTSTENLTSRGVPFVGLVCWYGLAFGKLTCAPEKQKAGPYSPVAP